MKNGFFIYILILMPFLSCSARIEGALRHEGSAKLSMEASLAPGTASLIRTLSRAWDSGGDPDAVIIDGPAISRSMGAAPGITGVSLKNNGPAAVAGEIHIDPVDAFLSLPEGRGGPAGGTVGGKADPRRFIVYEPRRASPPSPGRLTITLDRDSAPMVLSLMSEEVKAYLAALMAPAATGEVLSKADYLDQVGWTYGRAVADEIAAARVTAKLGFPGPVSGVRGGTFSGAQALFDIPLVDLLVLESPLEYEVRWN
ncbi:MAG: hypothetical protein LBP32_02320 [Spirochaetaceae bacterium]|jgi:hypothetical protein|nr:hypothetical protein [Spirochaetaceae bacterium]